MIHYFASPRLRGNVGVMVGGAPSSPGGEVMVGLGPTGPTFDTIKSHPSAAIKDKSVGSASTAVQNPTSS